MESPQAKVVQIGHLFIYLFLIVATEEIDFFGASCVIDTYDEITVSELLVDMWGLLIGESVFNETKMPVKLSNERFFSPVSGKTCRDTLALFQVNCFSRF